MVALHAADLLAVWAQTAQQNPVVVQCHVDSNPDSALVRVLLALLPSVPALLVAWLAFRWQSGNERKQWDRNQKAAHDQWIRDQKMAEWKALQQSIANIYRITNIPNGWNGKIASEVILELPPALKQVPYTYANCIFLEKFHQKSEYGEKLNKFIAETDMLLIKFRGQFEFLQNISNRTYAKKERDGIDIERSMDIATEQIYSLSNHSRDLLEWLQNEAKLDLEDFSK